MFILLPGGKSPKTLFQKLAELNIKWKNISLMATDDRVVPLYSSSSNTKNMKNELVNKIKYGVKPNLVNIFPKNNNDIEKGLLQIESFLKLNTPDLTFLGMGSDGHIAGIFNKNSVNNYCYDFKNKSENFRRITISMKFFINTKNIIFYILGRKKKKMLSSILLNNNHDKFIPAKFLLENNLGEKVIICDEETAPNQFSIGETIINL